jgi:hypothetical protein
MNVGMFQQNVSYSFLCEYFLLVCCLFLPDDVEHSLQANDNLRLLRRTETTPSNTSSIIRNHGPYRYDISMKNSYNIRARNKIKYAFINYNLHDIIHHVLNQIVEFLALDCFSWFAEGIH